VFYVDRKFKKEEVDVENFENEAVQFYKVFFDFAYYTLLTPFHFKYNGNEGTYVCKKNIRQRVKIFIKLFVQIIIKSNEKFLLDIAMHLVQLYFYIFPSSSAQNDKIGPRRKSFIVFYDCLLLF
jgi:hypothetical protein